MSGRGCGLGIAGMLDWGWSLGVEDRSWRVAGAVGGIEFAGVCFDWRDLLRGYGYFKLLKKIESDLQKSRFC